MRLSSGWLNRTRREAEARAQLPDKRTLGPQRAVLRCEHSPSSAYPVAEVRGDTVIANGERYSLEHCTNDVVAICTKHPRGDGQWLIDLPALKAEARAQLPDKRTLGPQRAVLRLPDGTW